MQFCVIILLSSCVTVLKCVQRDVKPNTKKKEFMCDLLISDKERKDMSNNNLTEVTYLFDGYLPYDG